METTGADNTFKVFCSKGCREGVVAGGDRGSRESCLVFLIIEIIAYLSFHEDDAVEGEIDASGDLLQPVSRVAGAQGQALGALAEAWGG